MTTRHPISAILTWFLAALALSPAVLAEDLDEPSSSLEWSFTPYAWALSLDGEARIATFEADIDVDFIEVLLESDRLIPVMAEIATGTDDWSLFLTTTFVHVGIDGSSGSVGPIGVESDVTTNIGWFDLAVAVPLIDDPSEPIGENDGGAFKLEAYAGARITLIDLELEVEGSIVGIPVGSAKGDHQEVWVEPMVGLNVQKWISEDVVLHFRADIGGFGAGSDLAWQAMATIGLEFELLGLPSVGFAGYRGLGQDYDSGSFAWDVVGHGPLLGIEIRF